MQCKIIPPKMSDNPPIDNTPLFTIPSFEEKMLNKCISQITK